MQCPSREELLALIVGELEADSRASIEAHLAECTHCTETERALAQSVPSQTLTSHARARADVPAAPQGHAAAVDVQPGTYVGRYLVLDLIGSGGMGSVYRAYDPKLNRNVAVKLIRVRSSAGEESPRPRLLREAQALAKVHHPHVVSVFDVGEFREQVFFAMELIDGRTLRDVLRKTDRDARKLLRLLDQAGRGLAAAHAVGLIHRDFKPENVLIDREQRVKVVDFGLARAIDAYKVEEDFVSAPSADSPSVLDQRITATGAFVGTPAYMSPEQFLGLPTDARSDQFSFSCVAFEALFGRHPFLTKGDRISMVALSAGKIVVPGPRLDPGYLRVLTRGLSRHPENRYPSLQHLLDELASVPKRRQRRVVAVAAVVCAAAALIAKPAIQKHRAQRCDTAAAQALDGLWDGARRAQIEGALTGDGKAFGRDVWQRVAHALDVQADQWKQANAELCRSTEWWRSEDNVMHKRSSACLDERRRELRAVTDVLAGADRDVRLRAPDLLIQLDSISACTNPAALALTPLPNYDAATSVAVDRIRGLLAQSRALNDARKMTQAEETARQALELARKIPDRALAAEALYRLSVVQDTSDQFDASEASIIQSLAEAEASGHERLLPLVWTELIGVVGIDKNRPSEVERLIPFTQAMVERFDPQGPAHVELLLVLGLIERIRGRYEQAIVHLDAALNLSQRVFGEHDIRRVQIYRFLASNEETIEQIDKAMEHVRAGLAEAEALFGTEHPQLVPTLSLLALMLSGQRDTPGVNAVAQRALHIIEQTAAPDSPDLASSIYKIATAYLIDNQVAVSLPLFRRAYDIDKKNDAANAAVGLGTIARAEELLGNLETARTTYEEALALARRKLGPGHPQTIAMGIRLGRLLRTLHRGREALQVCTELLEAGDRQLGKRGVYVALASSCVGEGYEELGQLPEALTALERAVKLLDEEKVPPQQAYRGLIRFALARVLWQTGTDRERALRLGREAADNYRHAGHVSVPNAVAVETWLAKNSAQPK